MDRGVYEKQVAPLRAQAVDRLLAAMSGTIVHDPKDATSGFIGLLAHDLLNQTIDRGNAALLFAAAEHLGPMYVPRGQIGPCTFTEILMFDSDGATRRRSQCRLLAATGLNTAFFVCRDDELARLERASLPNAIIQVEDAPGLGSEIRVPGKDPTAMSPGAKRIGAEPAP